MLSGEILSIFHPRSQNHSGQLILCVRLNFTLETSLMKRTFYCLSVAGLIFFSIGQVSAQTIIISNSPRPFSVVPPTSWIQRPTSTGNSRVKFVAPPGTPVAECAVIVKEIPSLRNQPQSSLDQQMSYPVDLKETASQMSARFNNVQIFETGFATISGHPSQLINLQYTIGTPSGEIWFRGTTITAATTPGLIWTITCGATGRTTDEAQKGYSYWQSEMFRFSTNVKILK